MHVTRPWRTAALATHAIWTRVRITSPAWQKVGVERRKDGREVCGTKAQLYRALRRAGNAPLDLQFALVNPKPTPTYRKHDHLAFKQMLALLAQSKKCLDVRALEINGPDYAHLQDWGEDGDGLIFPELRILRVKEPVYAEFVSKLAKTSTKVDDMEFVACSSYSGVQFGFKCLSMIRSLVSLSLDCQYLHASNQSDLEELKRFLANARSLVTFELGSFQVRGWPFSGAIHVPNLQTLVMKDSDICPMDLPNLTQLSLINRDNNAAEDYEVWGAILAPSGLTVVSWYHELGNLWWRKITFPPLHTLDVCFGGGREEYMEIIEHPERFNPVVFRSRKTALFPNSLVRMIGPMDSLEELELEGVTPEKGFFKYLAQGRGRRSNTEGSHGDKDEEEKAEGEEEEKAEEGEGEEGEWEGKWEGGREEVNCPRLVRVRIELKVGPPTWSERMIKRARGAAMARVEAGVLMEEWQIRCLGNGKWLECLH